MIEVKGISFNYRARQGGYKRVIEDISFSIPERTTCALIGPSGCGKTTLLYLLAGLLTPQKGEVLIQGMSPDDQKGSIAVILQDYGLMPWKDVRGNIAMGLKLKGLKKREYQDLVAGILEELGIEDIGGKYPAQLSGGQRQRVAIGRALALKPKLLLMDEPFSALDALTREGLQRFFLEVWQKHQMTAVFVTHSIEEAVYLGNKIIILSEEEGRIIEELDNQHFAQEGWRNSNSFYNQCEEIRSLLSEGMV
jgi:NitT/TauT family transport system ATP-binding protein